MIAWEKHIETIIGKLNKACYIMGKSKHYLSIDALKNGIYAFFSPSSALWLDFFGVIQLTVCVFLNCRKERLE
jgi:hypothetical protein